MESANLEGARSTPSCPEPPGAPRGGAAAKVGHCQGAALWRSWRSPCAVGRHWPTCLLRAWRCSCCAPP
eukprot:scaffold8635_cov32-Phaeocystis_antarctica.AAC.2